MNVTLSGSPQVVSGNLLTTGDVSQCILGKGTRYIFIGEQEHGTMLFKEKVWRHTGCRWRKHLFIWDSILVCPAWVNTSDIWRFSQRVNSNELFYCFWEFGKVFGSLLGKYLWICLNSSSPERTNSCCSVQIVPHVQVQMVGWCLIQLRTYCLMINNYSV